MVNLCQRRCKNPHNAGWQSRAAVRCMGRGYLPRASWNPQGVSKRPAARGCLERRCTLARTARARLQRGYGPATSTTLIESANDNREFCCRWTPSSAVSMLRHTSRTQGCPATPNRRATRRLICLWPVSDPIHYLGGQAATGFLSHLSESRTIRPSGECPSGKQ
jgi:hypothetical protein